MNLYQYKPTDDDPQRAALPWGFRLRVIPNTRRGEFVHVKDRKGQPLGFVSLRSLEVLG